MKKVLIILCALCITNNFVSASVMDVYDPGSLNQQYTREMRLHEFAARSKNHQNAIINTNAKQQTENSNTSSFVNNNLISTNDLNRVASYSLNKKATSENISALRSLITRYYQSNGYFSAIVTPNINNIQNGELILEIKEGSKNSIVVE